MNIDASPFRTDLLSPYSTFSCPASSTTTSWIVCTAIVCVTVLVLTWRLWGKPCPKDYRG